MRAGVFRSSNTFWRDDIGASLYVKEAIVTQDAEVAS
jgi:hypothetical protein